MQTASGFVPLLDNEFFPWGGLPYPCEHARLGVELAQKGEVAIAKKMIPFQQATLDHYKKPIHSFFRQEKGYSYAELEEANRRFFEVLEVEPEEKYHFVDSELGIVSYRDGEQTMVCLGSGCKSGMGLYLVGNSGVLTFAPQLLPLGECSGFGLAGRGQNIEASGKYLSYRCRLGAAHRRNTGISWLEDSGYCATWIESTITFEADCLKVVSELEGYRPLSDFLFSFFVKADACFIAGSHKLNPRSLDRYQGPPQAVKLNELTISPEEGFSAMEVVPLAGDESYWGADFMVTLTLLNKIFLFTISRT